MFRPGSSHRGRARTAVVLHRVLKAFQYRDFRVMWIGACTSTIGTWMQIVAQSWLIYSLSNSGFMLGLNEVLGGLPIFLFSLIGGVAADRMERRYLLLFSQYVQMTCAFLLTALVALHVVQVWHILTLTFISGFGQAFGGPAYSALIPTLVKKEDMPNAIALNSIQFNAAVMVGPALAGVTLAKWGNVWCFFLNGVSFLAPIIALYMLKVRFLPEKTAESIVTSMRQGFHFISNQAAMAALIILAFAMTFLAVPMRTFLPVFAKNIFHRGAETYALFLSVMGSGSIAGSLAVAAMGNIRYKGRVALTTVVTLGLGIAGLSLSHNIPFTCIMLFLSGASMLAVFTSVNSLVQLIVTNEMRGRVMSIYNFAFRGGMGMGNLAAGWLVPIFTAPVVLGVNGFMLAGLGLYFLLFQRRVAAL
jgi:MFS family permease